MFLSSSKTWSDWRPSGAPAEADPVPGRNGSRPDGKSASRDGEPGSRNGTSGSQSGKRVRVPFQAVQRGGQDRLVWAFNAAVALVALVLLAPVLAAIAVAIKLDSHGPVLYRQLRIGLDRRNGDSSDGDERRTLDLGGRPFKLYKFRTMHVDAETESGPVWSPAHDDRVTRVGRFLRAHRLDELPQLWNVVKGDMSIVGPRPERPSLVSDLREEIPEYPLRQKVLPGITGWAQVHRGADRTLDDVRSKLRFDLEYLEERSLLFDLRIMARTVPVMLEQDYRGEDGVEDHGRGRADGNSGGGLPRTLRT